MKTRKRRKRKRRGRRKKRICGNKRSLQRINKYEMLMLDFLLLM